MSTTAVPRYSEVLPMEAWALLSKQGAVLVDVRTAEEWAFVGVPETSAQGCETVFVSWLIWPDMSPNPSFVSDLDEQLAGQAVDTLLFICRSGVRSMHAAQTVSLAYAAAGREVACVNVVNGFEGGLCDNSQRGRLTGWKAAGLPWRQS